MWTPEEPLHGTAASPSQRPSALGEKERAHGLVDADLIFVPERDPVERVAVDALDLGVDAAASRGVHGASRPHRAARPGPRRARGRGCRPRGGTKRGVQEVAEHVRLAHLRAAAGTPDRSRPRRAARSSSRAPAGPPRASTPRSRSSCATNAGDVAAQALGGREERQAHGSRLRACASRSRGRSGSYARRRCVACAPSSPAR